MKTGLCSSFSCDYQVLFALPLKTLLKTSVATAGCTSCDHLSKSQASTIFQRLHPLQGTNLSVVKLPLDMNQI